MTRRFFAFAAAAGLMFGMVSSASANHIDYLSDGAFSLVASGSSATTTVAGAAGNVLGSEREVSIDFLGGSGLAATALFDVPTGAGPAGPNTAASLLFDTGSTSLAKLTLNYDGPGSSANGLNTDLTAGGAFGAAQVDISSIVGTFDVMVTYTDTMGNSSGSTQSVSSTGSYVFGFDGAVDYTSIKSVNVMFTSTTLGSDIGISQIVRVVPEPASVGLSLLGVAGIALIGRRKLRSAR